MNEKIKRFNTFKEFYPYYLAEHKNIICRRLHVTGSVLVVFVLLLTLFSGNWYLLFFIPLLGYGFAWVGHFFFVKTKPATFKYPFYSFLGDWVMFWQGLTRQLK